jgi:HD-like signal output (HDOD) protein
VANHSFETTLTHSHPTDPLSQTAQAIAACLSRQLADRNFDMPMLPDVASRVLALSNDPDSDAAQLARLIQGDPALSGHVMRIANSAAYTPNASMVSLQQAIARLGMALITEIALAASLNSKLFKAPLFKDRLIAIWDHALASALWGKEVARISKKNVEASFLCGLLHSIGRPVVLQSISEQLETSGETLSQQEARILEDQFHIAYGVVIVENWQMPVIVQEAVQYYQHYDQAKHHRDQAMIIHAADKLAEDTLACRSKGICELQLVLDDEVFAALNLYADEIEKLKEQKDKVLAGMEAMRE